MNDSRKPAGSQQQKASPPLSEAERKRRLARVFGDVLPDETEDDRVDRSDGPGRGGAGDEDWLRGQVPPHHG